MAPNHALAAHKQGWQESQEKESQPTRHCLQLLQPSPTLIFLLKILDRGWKIQKRSKSTRNRDTSFINGGRASKRVRFPCERARAGKRFEGFNGRFGNPNAFWPLRVPPPPRGEPRGIPRRHPAGSYNHYQRNLTKLLGPAVDPRAPCGTRPRGGGGILIGVQVAFILFAGKSFVTVAGRSKPAVGGFAPYSAVN